MSKELYYLANGGRIIKPPDLHHCGIRKLSDNEFNNYLDLMNFITNQQLTKDQWIENFEKILTHYDYPDELSYHIISFVDNEIYSVDNFTAFGSTLSLLLDCEICCHFYTDSLENRIIHYPYGNCISTIHLFCRVNNNIIENFCFYELSSSTISHISDIIGWRLVNGKLTIDRPINTTLPNNFKLKEIKKKFIADPTDLLVEILNLDLPQPYNLKQFIDLLSNLTPDNYFRENLNIQVGVYNKTTREDKFPISFKLDHQYYRPIKGIPCPFAPTIIKIFRLDMENLCYLKKETTGFIHMKTLFKPFLTKSELIKHLSVQLNTQSETILNKFSSINFKDSPRDNNVSFFMWLSNQLKITITLFTQREGQQRIVMDINRKSNQDEYSGFFIKLGITYEVFKATNKKIRKENTISIPTIDVKQRILYTYKDIKKSEFQENPIDLFLKKPSNRDLLSIPNSETLEIREFHALPDIEYKGFANSSYNFRVCSPSFEAVAQNSLGDYQIPIGDFKNIIHDFTFKSLVSQTDISFSDIGLQLFDEDDNKTPDYMKIVGNTLYVVEFTTRRTEDHIQLRKALEDKTLKYRDVILARIKHYNLKAVYYIISVGQKEVFTNLKLPQDVIENIHYRFRVANKIYNRVLDSKDFIEAETELSKKCTELIQKFNQIKVTNISTKISSKTLNNFNSKVTENDRTIVDDYVRKARMESFQEILDDLSTTAENLGKDQLIKTRLHLLEQKKNIFNKFQSSHETRFDNKAVVQLPLIIIKPSIKPNNDLILLQNSFRQMSQYKFDPTYSVWFSAINDGKIDEYDDIVSEVERLSKNTEEQIEIDKNQKKYRKNYNRFSYELTYDQELELAKIGVKGKAFRDNVLVVDYRSEKKRPFDYKKTDTKDIETYLKNNIIDNKLYNLKTDERVKNILDLLTEAANIYKSQDSNILLEFARKYQESWIGSYSRMISDIATELSISLHQHCTPNQVIIKKLKFYNLYLLIKPTDMNNKLFYSIGWFKDDIINSNEKDLSGGTVFKKYSIIGDFCFTEFVSTNISKLTNMCRAESMGLATLIFWLEFYQIEKWYDKDINVILKNSPQVLRMLKFTNLVLLNDKHGLEELITSSRFIHMEGCVTFPAIINCGKMYEKFSPILRSRLEVYVLKCLDQLIKDYTIIPPSECIVDNETKRWTGFKNPFSWDSDSNQLESINNQDQMLNLCYIGYLKNKDEDPEANSEGAMLSKILGLEEKLPITDDNEDIDRKFLGEENPSYENCNIHEFSPSFIKVMCDQFLEEIKKEKGVIDPKKYLGMECMKFLSHQYMDTFATLKATSNFSEEWYVYDKDHPYHRSKVIEKVLKILNNTNDDLNNVLVVDFMKDALEALEKLECLHICIFKKNQHGGLREIYVLTLDGRIVQKTLEDLSRCILKNCPSEIMTHPKNKFQIPELHNRKIRKLTANNYKTYATSDDAAKWNQGHYVTKFTLMLCQLLPTYLHGFIIRSTQLWLVKKIKISDDLLKCFNNNININTSDDTLKSIFEVYKGRITKKWMKPGQSFITTESGMMQGILHYTSSLFHALYLGFLKKESELMLLEMMPDNRSNSFCVDVMESSDDSSMIISVPFFDSIIDPKLSILIYIIFKMKEKLGNILSIIKSIKSTTFTLFLMEFNSEFFFFGDVHRPTFRWVNACVQITEQENLMARQEEFYNLITNILQGGGSLILSYFCQISQSFIHYRLMGSSVSDLWPMYQTLIKDFRDPALGFFFLDHPMMAGIPGLNYNLWLNCKETKLGVKYNYMLNEELTIEDKTIKNITAETASIGLFSRTNQIIFGSDNKWKKIMKSFENDSNWAEEIDSNPKLLYFKPKTVHELKLKLLVKMKSPGVIASLGKTNVLPRIICSSVYILSRPVLMTQSIFYSKIKADEKPKVSLLSELIYSNIKIKKEVSNLRQNTVNFNKNLEVSLEEIDSYEKNVRLDYSLLEIIYNIFYLELLPFEQFKNGYIYFLNQFPEEHDYNEILANYTNTSLYHMKKAKSGQNFKIHYITIPEMNENYLCFVVKDEMITILDMSIDDIDSISNISTDNFKFSIDQESLLFPHVVSYESLKSTQDALQLKNSIPKTNYRRKQRSDLKVTGSDDPETIKMEQVLIWVWFGVNTAKLATNTMILKFESYKKLIPWLHEDIKETLKRSPFSNHIQLQNFLSRQDKSNRTVHLTGSYGKNKFGISNITTVIKHNFSNGTLFPDIYDQRSLITTQDMQTLMHTLTTLTRFPIENELKVDMCLQLLRDSPEFRITTSPNSKISKMSVIQSMCKLNPDLHLPIFPSDSKKKWMEKRCQHLLFSGDVKKWQDIIFEEMVRKENEGSLDYQEFALEMEELIPTYGYNIAQLLCEGLEEDDDDQIIEALILSEEEILTDDLYKALIGRNGMNMYVEGRIKTLDDIIIAQNTFYCAIPELMNKISQMRLGIQGYYTRTQSFDVDNKKYFGEGIWIGKFDDIIIEIHIDSDISGSYLNKIKINSSRQVETTLKYLESWCQDNHVNNDLIKRKLNMSQKNIFCYLINFKSSNKYKEGSCPIILDERLVYSDILEFTSYRLDISERNLRLLGFYDYQESSKYVTIVSIPLHLNNLILDFQNYSLDNFPIVKSWPPYIVDWITMNPNGKGMQTLMNMINEETNYIKILLKLGFNYEEFSDWLSNLWFNRLERDLGELMTSDVILEVNEISSDVITEERALILKKEYERISNIISQLSTDLLTNMSSILSSIEMTPLSTQAAIDYLKDEEDKDVTQIERIHPYLSGLILVIGEDNCRFIKSKNAKSSSNLIIPSEIKQYKPLLSVLFGKNIENIILTDSRKKLAMLNLDKYVL